MDYSTLTVEQLRELLLQRDDSITEMQSTIDTQTATIAERDETIEDLRTHNQKLFLRVSQGSEDPEKEDSEPSETLEEYARKHLEGVIKQ